MKKLDNLGRRGENGEEEGVAATTGTSLERIDNNNTKARCLALQRAADPPVLWLVTYETA